MTHTRRHHGSRRGFMLIFAVTLLILIGATLALLATLFAGEARRTQNQAIDAQLRQILIAGTIAAQHEMKEVALPAELSEAKVTITSEGAATIVQAEYRGRKMGEKVTFTGTGNARKLASAQLLEY